MVLTVSEPPLRPSAALAALLVAAPAVAAAQSPDWSANLVIQAFPSPYLSDWERVPSTALLSVTHTGSAPADFIVSVTLRSTERGFVGTIESPGQQAAGGVSTFLFNARDAVTEWGTRSKNAALTDVVVRTGQIPEGRYRACATVLVGAARTPSAESCADFTILLPDPPQLVTPLRGDLLRTSQPFFSWTPVLAPPDLGVSYRLRVVEVIGTQAPLVALTANIPLLDEVVAGAPFRLYPLDGVALEAGKRYAWRVTAVTADGLPLFRDRVASEIGEFTMATDLLGALPTLATLGDTAVVQPGVAALRGLRRATVRPDLVAGTYVVDGPLELVLAALPGSPAVPVQASGLRIGMRGDLPTLVAGELRASRPAAPLLADSLRAFVGVRELRASAQAGVVATLEVRVPGQGAIQLAGNVALTALGWYGRAEGATPATAGPFARAGRGAVALAFRRARVELPAGVVLLGGAVEVGGAACEDTWSSANDGVVRATLSCRPSGAMGIAARGPADFQADGVAGRVVADLLADTVGFELAVVGRARLFGAGGSPCHAEAVLRLTSDSARVLQQDSRCDRERAVQLVAPWLRLRYGVLRIDTLARRDDGSLRWVLGFRADPELVASPGLDLPAFENAYATRDSIVLPAPPDLLQPDAPAIVEQFRVVTRRGRGARVARAWDEWANMGDAPFAWTLEGDAWFEPSLRDVDPCLASRFRISPDTAGFVVARGRMSWTARRADFDQGCVTQVSPSVKATVYRIFGRVGIALGTEAVTDTLPRAFVVLADPKWPAPVPSVPGTTGPLQGTALGGLLTTVANDVAGAMDDVADQLRTIEGAMVNGILDGVTVCGLLRGVGVDFRGRFRGDVPVQRGCEVKVGLGRLTTYSGRFAFGPLLPAGGQQLRWLGGTRVSLDTSLSSRSHAEDSVRTARAKDSTARADSAYRAGDPTWQRIAALNRQKDSLDAVRAQVERTVDSLQVADSLEREPLHGQAQAAADRLGRLRELVDSVKLVADTMELTKLRLDREAKARADSVRKAAADTSSSGGLLGGAAGTAGGIGGSALAAPGAGEADDPDTEIDWNTGRIIRGSWRLRGPFVVQPFAGFAFRLRDVPFDTAGLRVDGSVPLLYQQSADSAMTTWSGVRLDFVAQGLRAGIITLPAGFAVETGTTANLSGARVDSASGGFAKALAVAGIIVDVAMAVADAGNWRVRPGTGAAAFTNGLRVAIGGQPTLDARGLAMRGDAPITGSLLGSAPPPSRLRMSDDFVLRDWKTVAQGRATLEVGSTPIATWDAGGWHVATAGLVAAVLPKRIPLPSEAVAYVQVRDSVTDALLVEMADEGDAWRLTTPRGPATLVVPALAAMLGGDAPRAAVTFDVRVDKRTLALVSGSVATSVRGVPGFDLSRGGLPFALERVAYEKPAGGAYRLGFEAGLALLGEASPTGRLRLTVDGNGAFAGDVALPVARALDLGAPQVQLQVDALEGTIGGSVAQGIDFRIDARGGLRVSVDPANPWLLATTLRLSPAGAEFVTSTQGAPPTFRLGVPGAALLLGNPRLPLLAWDAAQRRVRFDMLLDVGVEVASLGGLALPAIRDVHLRETGLEIPAFEIGEVSMQMIADGAFGVRAAGPIEAAGFGVRPLALRFGGLRWTFGAAVPAPDVRLDVELSVRDPSAPPPNDLSAFKVRVLGLGWRDDALRGTIEPVEFAQGLPTPFGTIRTAWGSFAVGARSEAHVYVGADVRLPDVFGCGAQAPGFAVATRGGKDTLELMPGGGVRGTVTGFVPSCSGTLGPATFRVVQSRLEFAAGPGVAPRATLAGAIRASLPSGVASDSVRADGSLAVNLITGELLDASVTIASPFRWRPDPRNPILEFTVQGARLDRDAFMVNGSGTLALVGGGGATVRFDSLAWGWREARFTRGRAAVLTDLALGAEIGEGGLAWGAFPADRARPTGPGFRLTLPAGMVIDSAGITIDGTAIASLQYGADSYADLSVAFEGGFRLATTGPVRVLRGAARMRRGSQELIATIDSTGFRPGDVFAVLPIPNRLGLPTQDVAYLVLGDSTRRFVELVTTPDGLSHLRTPAGRTIDLVMPSLAYGGTVPTVRTAFDLVVEPRTMAIVGGSLLVEAPPGQSLVPLQNIPVDVQRLGFAAGQGGWQLTASARVRLPGALAATPLVLDNVVVGPRGLSGVAEIGTVTDRWQPGLPTVASATILGDSLRLALHGARVAFSSSAAPDVTITGSITTALLSDPTGAPAPLFLRGSVGAQQFEAAADLSALGGQGIPLGVAVLRPGASGTSAPIRFVASAQRTGIEFGASLELTALSPGLVVGIDTIRIGTDGVRVSPVNVTGANGMAFNLFGLQFTLRDSLAGGTRVYPALAGRFDGRHLRVEMTGDVRVMENTTRFTGLRVGTDGTLGLAGASLLSRPVQIIGDNLRLDSLDIRQNALHGVVAAVLPAPFDQRGVQKARLSVSADGRVNGGGTISIISEPEGLRSAQTKVDVGVATFHMRYLAVTLDFERPRERTSVDLVSDIYIANDEANLVRLGRVSGGTVQAGLRFSLAGVSWSGLEVPRPINVKLGPVKLTLTRATATTSPRGLSAAISGALGLAFEQASGGLAFEDVRLTEAGELSLAAARISGGTISIADSAFTLDVRNLGYSDSDTTIAVPGDNLPPTDGEASVPPTRMVRVSSFLSFTATASIAKTFSGGVRRLLVYTLAEDSTLHILVDSLGASVSDVFSLTANMRFDEYTDGFGLQVSGDAQIAGGVGVMMAGVIAQRGGTLRAGIFVAARGINIQLVPGVVSLVGVGGGFFINPEASDLAMVQRMSGVTGAATASLGPPPASKFAIMLYAEFIGFGQGSAALVAGRALVTVSDQAFRLDARVAFLNKNKELVGNLALQVGWEPEAYLLGNVTLNVNFDSVAVGTAQLRFAVGGNAFAVKGLVDMQLVSVLNARVDVVIVPSGFAVDMGIRLVQNFWVVRLDVGLAGALWFRPATSDLGAYVELTGRAEIPGVIGIEARLTGALIIMPKFGLYLAGMGRAYVLGESVSIAFWLAIGADGAGAGLGENPELTAAIARAKQVAAELRAEADSILDAVGRQVASLSAQPVVASDATLLRTFENAGGWLARKRLADILIIAFQLDAERQYGAGVGRLPYYPTYLTYLTQSGAPSDTAAIAAVRVEAQRKLDILASRRDEMLARIAALQSRVDSVRAVTMPDLPNPVRQFTRTDATVVEAAAPASAAGGPRVAATLANVPVLDVDDAVAQRNRQAMQQTATEVAARQREVVRALEQAQGSLDSVRAALAATQSSSLMGYLRLWADAVEATEQQHARTVDYVMRRWKWAREGFNWVAGNRDGFRTDAFGITSGIASSSTLTDNAKFQKLDTVNVLRVNSLAFFGGDSTARARYDAFKAQLAGLGGSVRVAAMKQQADTLAMQLYNDAARLGLARLDTVLQAEAQRASQAGTDAVRRVRAAHAEVSDRVGELADAQLELYGATWDLYDAVLRELPPTDSLAVVARARRDALRPLLQAPQLAAAQVTVEQMAFMSRARYTWSATHPLAVPEYTVVEGDTFRRSMGSLGSYGTWKWSTDMAGGFASVNATLGARAAAGTRVERAAPPITMVFAQGTATAPVVATASALQPDVTPPGAVLLLPSTAGTTRSGDGSTSAWVTRGTAVALQWSAGDLESGVAEYRYRVIERDPPTDAPLRLRLATTSTTSLSVPQPVELVPWTSLGGRTTMLFSPPVVSAGKVAQVEVLAVNGVGLTGNAGALVLREDLTPPAAPATTTLSVGGTGTRGAAGFATRTIAPTCAPPSPFPTLSGATILGMTPSWLATATGAITVAKPPITDPESGVREWWVKVDTVRPTAVDGSGWVRLTDTTGTTFTIAGMPYEQPRWIAVAARNSAGAFGPPVTSVGPVTLFDPSAPSAPAVCMTASGTSLAVRVELPSTDAESGIRGYQVRLRTQAGTVLRNWPKGTIDIPASVGGNTLTVLSAVPLPSAGLLIADVRAVNGGWTPGHEAASGVLQVDFTPPPAPTITSVAAPVLNRLSTATLTIGVSTSPDPESGFTGLEVMVEGPEETLVRWSALKGAVTGASTYTITLPAMPTGLRVWVRARNGTGLWSTAASATWGTLSTKSLFIR